VAALTSLPGAPIDEQLTGRTYGYEAKARKQLAMPTAACSEKLWSPSFCSSAGYTKGESTIRYLGIEFDDALILAEQINV
jgi:hypothetical protein